MKWSLTEDAAKTMVHAFVVSRVTLLYITASSIVAVHMPLQNVLNYAAQIILRKRKLDRITADLRDQLHLLPVHQRIEYNVCVLVYKCLQDTATTYLAETCTPVSTSVNWNYLRSATHGDLIVPRFRTTRYGQRCFTVSGPTLCNTAVDRVWPITDTDWVLCTVENCAILHSLWNTAITPQWQHSSCLLTLYLLTAHRKFPVS